VQRQTCWAIKYTHIGLQWKYLAASTWSDSYRGISLLIYKLLRKILHLNFGVWYWALTNLEHRPVFSVMDPTGLLLFTDTIHLSVPFFDDTGSLFGSWQEWRQRTLPSGTVWWHCSVSNIIWTQREQYTLPVKTHTKLIFACTLSIACRFNLVIFTRETLC